MIEGRQYPRYSVNGGVPDLLGLCRCKTLLSFTIHVHLKIHCFLDTSLFLIFYCDFQC